MRVEVWCCAKVRAPGGGPGWFERSFGIQHKIAMTGHGDALETKAQLQASETRCRSRQRVTCASAIIEVFIPLACDCGGNSTPECGLQLNKRRLVCIGGVLVHLDCLYHFLLETKKKHTHTHRGDQYNERKCRPTT
jgi:hypothetical protein